MECSINDWKCVTDDEVNPFNVFFKLSNTKKAILESGYGSDELDKFLTSSLAVTSKFKIINHVVKLLEIIRQFSS